MSGPRGPGNRLELGAEASGAALNVLIIEPHGYSSGELQEAAGHVGIAVESARDAKAALRRLRERRYDAVLIDLPTAGMQDRELFQQIASLSQELAQRVVFLVNDLGDSRTRRFLSDAGRPFLTQPADPLELCDLVWRIAAGDDGASPWPEGPLD